MKRSILLVLSGILLMCDLIAQQTIHAAIGDFVDITIDAARGDLTWQVSTDNVNWDAIPSAQSATLMYEIAALPSYFRLQIEEGTCNIHYSEVLTVADESAAPKVLLFVSYERTYYSEYKVMLEALQARGYDVEVRSAATGSASVYTLSGDLNDALNQVPGSDYATFTSTFADLFGTAWNPDWNATPAFIPVDGRIQDVEDMDEYAALVIVGGTGALDYRVDGSYETQFGDDGRAVSAADVQAAAEHLNFLAIDALGLHRPVMAQCHGASLPAFFRFPDTSGPGAEALGYSLLKGGQATGFPDETDYLAELDITPRVTDKVVVSSPYFQLPTGANRVITTRDWYVQTVTHAAQTLLNVMETYVVPFDPVSVLILHGGAVDTDNCGSGNKTNDIPCNSGSGQMPADYSDVEALLSANSANDDFTFTVAEVNLTDAGLPFDLNNQAAIEAYLAQYDVVYFYKHWSTGVTTSLQNALVAYADNGGGVVSNHHGMYNDIDGANNKDILASQVVGVQSTQAGWGQNLTTYDLFMTNYGHFITTYGITLGNVAEAPGGWSTFPIVPGTNASHSFYQTIEIWDELYTNMAFVGTPVFGDGINEITPLLSNNVGGAISHTSGIARRIDPSEDGTVGRVVYFQPGDIKGNTHVSHPFGQMLRNAVMWAGGETNSTSSILPVSLLQMSARSLGSTIQIDWSTATELNNARFELFRSVDAGHTWEKVYEIQGEGTTSARQDYSWLDDRAEEGINYYRLHQIDHDGTVVILKTVFAILSYSNAFDVAIFPNPTSNELYFDLPGVLPQESIRVFDLAGNALRPIWKGPRSIEMSHLPPGQYIVRFSMAGFHKSWRIVKE